MDQKRDVIIVMAAAMLCSLSLAFAAETTMAGFTQSPYVPSACFESTDMGIHIAGFGDPLWSREICGQKLKVTCVDDDSENCKSSSVTVTVVDHCEKCPNSITLSEEAFDIIAKTSAGNVKVEYEPVSG